MKAFLTGLGIGVGLGILLAPEGGEATRSKVRDKINDWTDRLSRQVENVNQSVAAQADELSQRVSGARREESDTGASKKPQATAAAKGDLINTVSREELMTVNGIGPVLADRIISGRPYSSLRALLERGIIAQGTFEELERQFGTGQTRSA